MSRPWIVDTGPLSHFAKASWLGLLKAMAQERPVIIPDVVYAEIERGQHKHPHLRTVLDATSSWIEVCSISSLEELALLSKYTSFLVGEDSQRNLGECGVLALAEITPGIAILDDRAARNAADENQVEKKGTVALILEAVREHQLPRELAASVADDLLATEYRLPFEKGLFIRWAVENGHL